MSTEQNNKKNSTLSFRYTLDITIESPSQEQSEKTLMQLLQSQHITQLQMRLHNGLGSENHHLSSNLIESDSDSSEKQSIVKMIQQFITDNKLLRLSVVKGHGVHLNIPCRILSYDASTDNLTVYHVDEKKVYLFTLNEIDDFIIR